MSKLLLKTSVALLGGAGVCSSSYHSIDMLNHLKKLGRSNYTAHCQELEVNETTNLIDGRTDTESLKKVGYKAIDEFVTSGMNVGFGSGLATTFALERLRNQIKDGKLNDITIIPSSFKMAQEAELNNIPVTTLGKELTIHLMIDSAIEVDKNLNISKNNNGNFLREKMIKEASNQYLCLIDESRLSKNLGSHPISIEVTPFCSDYIRSRIEQLPCLVNNVSKAVVRKGNLAIQYPDGLKPAMTNNGNYVIDLYFSKPLINPCELVYELDTLTGVVEHSMSNSGNISVLVAEEDDQYKWIGFDSVQKESFVFPGKKLDEVLSQQYSKQKPHDQLEIAPFEVVPDAKREDSSPRQLMEPWWVKKARNKEERPMDFVTVEHRQIE